VSLASWSNSKVFQRLKEVYETELQIDTFSDPEERKAAVAVFIGTISLPYKAMRNLEFLIIVRKTFFGGIQRDG
jgi:hypothetical protein